MALYAVSHVSRCVLLAVPFDPLTLTTPPWRPHAYIIRVAGIFTPFATQLS